MAATNSEITPCVHSWFTDSERLSNSNSRVDGVLCSPSLVSISSQPIYGDLIAVRDSSAAIIHMWVYIGEGFVFTKNWIDPDEPWVLMRMTDMLTLYHASEADGQVAILRRLPAA
jgi:hypothetical protein